MQCSRYLVASDVHSHRMSLHDARCSIDIDYQSGQIVALAMYQTISGIDGFARTSRHVFSWSNDTNGFPDSHRCL